MPCQDGGPTAEEIRRSDLAIAKKLEAERDIQRRLDLATRLLCGVLYWMKNVFHIDIYDSDTTHQISDDVTIEEVRRWWTAHKHQDQIRLRKENAARIAKKGKLREEIKKLQKDLENLG